jgi:hypothetical protein
MDHSPSEQLGEDPNQWHTSAAIFSEGGEHWHLADDIAKRMNLQGGTLKRWAKNPEGSAYRAKFEATFTERVSDYPVRIRAISAQGSTMLRMFPELLKQMQIERYVEAFTRNSKPYLCFGPFLRARLESWEQQLTEKVDPVTFNLPEKQAIPIIFMCHFLLSAHKSIVQEMRASSPELEWIDWQLMPNKFPRDIDGPVARLFHAVLSLAEHANAVQGSLRIATLQNSQQDHGSALADNIAGLLNQKARSSNWALQESATRGKGSSMLWSVCR